MVGSVKMDDRATFGHSSREAMSSYHPIGVIATLRRRLYLRHRLLQSQPGARRAKDFDMRSTTRIAWAVCAIPVLATALGACGSTDNAADTGAARTIWEVP